MTRNKSLSDLVQQLVGEAYSELENCDIDARWGRTSCFATISWTPDRQSIRIMCNKETKKWHEGALFGLLSHELSHPAQRKSITSERSTDIDVIERGLGPYLAVERAITGKYEDYEVRRGKDMYLGYRTIRTYLTEEELQQLEFLLDEMRLIPSAGQKLKLEYHELAITRAEGRTAISIDGHVFYVDVEAIESNIKTIPKEGSIYVYLNGREIGRYNEMEP
jgi:hypothetical protein